MRYLRAAALSSAAAIVLALAACTSSDGDADGSPTPTDAPGTTAPTSVTPPASTATTTAPSASATASPSTSASSSPSSSTSTAPAFTTTCRTLSVRVLKGGAIRGAEIAAMQFVNEGKTACTITGAPTAVLLREGKLIGAPSRPNTDPVRPFTLQPGDVGESLLRDFSTCNAPLSDNLRLVTPTHNGVAGRTVTEPVTLRACELRVAPVGTPA